MEVEWTVELERTKAATTQVHSFNQALKLPCNSYHTEVTTEVEWKIQIGPSGLSTCIQQTSIVHANIDAHVP